jgi:hypothetical protein
MQMNSLGQRGGKLTTRSSSSRANTDLVLGSTVHVLKFLLTFSGVVCERS